MLDFFHHLLSQEFWVSIAVVIFVFLVFKPAKKLILQIADRRSNLIAKELADAKRLLKEADHMLKTVQQKQLESTQLIEDLMDKTHAEIIRFRTESMKDLDAIIKKRTDMALNRINNYEHNVMQELQKNAVDIAVHAIHEIVRDSAHDELTKNMIHTSLSSIQRRHN